MTGRLFRMKADLTVDACARAEHCLVLCIPRHQVKVMAQKLMDVLSEQVPEGAQEFQISLGGSIQQHFEEWRSIKGEPDATSSLVDSVCDDQDEERDD